MSDPALTAEVSRLRAELAEANAEVRSVTNQLTHTVNDLAEARRQAHRDATNHQQILRAKNELANERDALKAKLDMPCGSCHPCTNYTDETWRAAGRKPPHVIYWDDVQAELTALRPIAAVAKAWVKFEGLTEQNNLTAAVQSLPDPEQHLDICPGYGCPGCKADTTRGCA